MLVLDSRASKQESHSSSRWLSKPAHKSAIAAQGFMRCSGTLASHSQGLCVRFSRFGHFPNDLASSPKRPAPEKDEMGAGCLLCE